MRSRAIIITATVVVIIVLTTPLVILRRQLRAGIFNDGARPPAESARDSRIDLLRRPPAKQADATARVSKPRRRASSRDGAAAGTKASTEALTGQLDTLVARGDSSAVGEMLRILQSQSDPDERERVLKAIMMCEGRDEMLDDMLSAFGPALDQAAAPAERIAIQNAFADIPDQRAVVFLQSAFASPKADPGERANAATLIFDIGAANAPLLAPETVNDMNARLRADLTQAENPEHRVDIVGALGRHVETNRQFLETWRATENDVAVKHHLNRILDKRSQAADKNTSASPNA
ncbi:MAG: hypothetical protein WCK47_07265 [bacterium]|nr:hypothetical protein [Candidatus Sumerlaeota bacterium]